MKIIVIAFGYFIVASIIYSVFITLAQRSGRHSKIVELGILVGALFWPVAGEFAGAGVALFLLYKLTQIFLRPAK